MLITPREATMSKNEDQLETIQKQLTAIVQDRLGALDAVLRTTENLTRRIIAAEIETGRHRDQHAQLTSELDTLTQEVEQSRELSNTVRTRHTALLDERNRLRGEIERLDRIVRDLDGQVTHDQQIQAARESEVKELQTENNSLRKKVKTLEDNIVRMQRLKEELMSSVTGLAQQLRQASGSE